MSQSMTGRRALLLAALVVGFCWTTLPLAPLGRADAAVPTRLTDREFWTLIPTVSEPDGTFRSDNLLSNELSFQHVISDLTRIAKPGRAYMGVGPEQNFTYIAALEPSMAFIVDVRRGNLHLHLLYKALFELSADRAEFVSRLFSKKRPSGLSQKSTPWEIFEAYANVDPSESLYSANMAEVRNQLITTHGFDLTADDVKGIEFVDRAFFTFGTGIQYSPIGLGGATTQPTYAELMAATDDRGRARSYLSSEEAFGLVKGLERANLIVPVVGNFAGPKAIRAVGRYLRQKGTKVSAFYLSNVEEYLMRDGLWKSFCANVSTLPIDDTSLFIRSLRTGSLATADALRSELGAMSESKNCESSAR